MVIKRIGPLSCAKMVGTLYALLGIVLGAIFSLIAMAGGLASNRPGTEMLGPMIGVGAIIIFPLLYGCLGFIVSLIGAWLYNAVAGLVGGIEIDVQ